MDRSRFLFRIAASLLLLGAVFLAGLWSAHRENAVFRAVFKVYDDARTLVREIPNLRRTAPIRFLRPAVYPGDGVTINLPAAGPDDLILLSGFLKDDNKVRLMQRDGTVVNEWTLRIHQLFENPGQCRNPPATDWNATPHGTIITPEGDIVFSYESCGMVRLDRCGKPVWPASSEVTHHSPEWAEDGSVTISGGYPVDPATSQIPWPFTGPYWEDTIDRFGPDGKLLLRKAFTELLIENGLQAQLTATGDDRPWLNGEFHVNNVEQLSAALAPDFPMFATGDLLISARNLNMLLVTDAEVKTIKWWKIGPWIRQHDPDFQPGGRITLFDNHNDGTADGSRGGGSRIWSVNPATDEMVTLYGGRADQPLFSPERGTHQVLPDGQIMITEAEQGRSLQVTPSGEIVWEFINRFDADRITWTHDTQVHARGFFTVTDWSCN